MAESKARRGEKSDEKSMTFLEHLAELRGTILRSLLATVICCVPFLVLFDRVSLPFFLRLLPDDPDVYLSLLTPYEMYVLMIKVAVVLGLFVALPYVLYETWKFIAPGLYSHERRLILPFVLSGWLLFLVGITFCYTVVLPLSLKVMWHFGFIAPVTVEASGAQGAAADAPGTGEEATASDPESPGKVSYRMRSEWRAKDTIDFLIATLLGFGIAFNLPVVLVGLSMLGIVRSETLAGARGYCFLAACILGAVLTPQDVLSMFLLALPLYVLFEGSLIAMRVVERRDRALES